MSKQHIVLLAVGLVLLLIKPLHACLWDDDTLKMERERFPSALELITGNFVRHSQAYYLWRIEDRTKKIEADPDNPELRDDLAVALDKTGQHDKAIEAIKAKMALSTEGESDTDALYKSYANLGTFHIHNGELETGLEYIKLAIEINPDAHFGREIYQQRLVEYILSRQFDGKLTLPMSTDVGRYSQSHDAKFATFLLKNVPENKRELETKKAIKGILGMMRFGNYDSPILLEALGHLLLAWEDTDAKQLAARAFLKASYEVDDSVSQEQYREMARQTLTWQTLAAENSQELKLKQLESDFKTELRDAKSLFDAIQLDEETWIENNEDVDAKFAEKYYVNTPQAASSASSISSKNAMIFVASLILVAIVMLLLYFRFSRSNPPNQLREQTKFENVHK